MEEIKTAFDFREECQTFHDLALEFYLIVEADPPELKALRVPFVRSAKIAYMLEDVFSRRTRQFDMRSMSIELHTIAYQIWGGVEEVEKIRQATGPRGYLDSLDWNGNPQALPTEVLKDNQHKSCEIQGLGSEVRGASRVEVDSDPVAEKLLQTEEPLSPRAQHVLIAMFELAAFDSDRRRTTEAIAAKAIGWNADANALKAVMSDLKTRGLIETKSGSGGGCWLTERGIARAEKLQKAS